MTLAVGKISHNFYLKFQRQSANGVAVQMIFARQFAAHQNGGGGGGGGGGSILRVSMVTKSKLVLTTCQSIQS